MNETWLDLARDNRNSANELIQKDHFRSSATRAYFAVYSKISYEIERSGLSLPAGLEGPSHSKLRPTIEKNLTHLGKENKRVALSQIVGRLYDLRVYADYRPSITFRGHEAREALSLMKKAFEAF